MKNSRRKLTPEFKTKVALAALKNEKSISELAKDFNIHPSQISTWKSELMNNAPSIFGSEKDKKKKRENDEKEVETLYSKIGQLQVEVDFLKKALS